MSDKDYNHIVQIAQKDNPSDPKNARGQVIPYGDDRRARGG